MTRTSDEEFPSPTADHGGPSPSALTGGASSAGAGGGSDEPPRTDSEEGEEPEEIDLEEGQQPEDVGVTPPTGGASGAGAGGGSDEPPGTDSEEGEEPEEIDLEEGQQPTVVGATPPSGIPRKIENVRAQIARALVAVLAVVILFSFLTLWMVPSKIDQIETLLTIIFGPLIALVSGAVGYYFGGKS